MADSASTNDELRAEVARLNVELDTLRALQIDEWVRVVAEPDAELRRHRAEINALHETLSWRITKPLRAVRGA